MGSSAFHFHDNSNGLPTSFAVPLQKTARPFVTTAVLTAMKLAISIAIGFSFGYFYFIRTNDVRNFSDEDSGAKSFKRASISKKTADLDSDDPLTFITLSFGSKGSWRHTFITHNCIMLNNATLGNNRLIIYTDNMSQPYCSACECKKFEPVDCPCPPNGRNCDTRRQCEKMYFTIRMLQEYSSFVFLDHDLVILKDFFPRQLAERARNYDFLASRTHLNRERYFGNSLNYHQVFNSGLFFIRRLPNLNVQEPAWLMYNETKQDANTDQVYLSQWIFKRYDNWDELSFRWHCRDFQDQNIPFDHCYTLHNSGQPRQLLEEMNFNLLDIPQN